MANDFGDSPRFPGCGLDVFGLLIGYFRGLRFGNGERAVWFGRGDMLVRGEAFKLIGIGGRLLSGSVNRSLGAAIGSGYEASGVTAGLRTGEARWTGCLLTVYGAPYGERLLLLAEEAGGGVFCDGIVGIDGGVALAFLILRARYRKA